MEEVAAEKAHHQNKIILLLMIKNESRIIERCLEHALPHVDAVSILDTGSTDETVSLCQTFLSTKGKPFKIAVEPFKNFGYNRTVSFQTAQELCTELNWDAEKTYALAVDADMVICPKPAFKDVELTLNGYSVIQSNGHINYYNMRLMKCAHPWKCIGGTHEYWSGDPTGKVPYEVFYIDDRNDGGCKSDKFERDVRLLKEDIQENPKNDRAHYYLGQSLKDLGRFEEAIEMFTKRIELGGWYEENWYAHYQIGKCYEHMNRPLEMEVWMNKAFEFHSRRAEPLYHLCRYFREKSQHYKAYHYYQKGKDIPYPKDDVLFIEDQVYRGLFDYENTILACYVNGKTKQDSLVDVVQYINRGIPHFLQNVWDNLHYYAESLTSPLYKGEYTKFLFHDHEEYKVSSCCLLPFSALDSHRRYVLNTRYVNYSIDAQGCYHMRSADGNVKTKNGIVFLNASYQPTEQVRIVQENYSRHPSNIEGLEDIRLFFHEGRVRFTASSKNITSDGRIVIACGEYEPHHATLSNVHVLEPPRPSSCEKNWVYVPNRHLTAEKSKGRMNFIYGWNPLEIGSIQEENHTMEIHTTYQTPALFNRFRGSSPLCEYNGKLYAVVHFVKYSQPRVYYHSIVQFDRDTMKPEKYAVPFCFRRTAIEYCLGFDVKEEMTTFLFSENDTDPGMVRVPFQNIRWLQI
jgi:tetratricopeptide (TPR) repeat protein